MLWLCGSGWLVLYESYEMGLILLYLAFVVFVCVFVGICLYACFLLYLGRLSKSILDSCCNFHMGFFDSCRNAIRQVSNGTFIGFVILLCCRQNDINKSNQLKNV